MNFPIFEKTKLDTHNLKAVLDLHLQTNPNTFFTDGYEQLLHPNGAELFLQTINNSTEPVDIFAKAVLAHSRGDTTVALAHLTTLLEQGVDSPIIYFNLLRYNLTLTRKYPARNLEDAVQKLIPTLIPAPQTLSQIVRLFAISKATIRNLFS
jgi:hypothetical protein